MKFKRLKNQEGAAIVEFAVVLPLFLVLTFGIIEFGVIMYDQAVITNASREGARFGILFDVTDTSDAAIQAKVTEYINNTNLYSLGGAATHTTPPIVRTITADGTYIEVPVTYPYDFLLIPAFIPGISGTLTLSATTTMRKE